jgi:signal transduction histidine kinase
MRRQLALMAAATTSMVVVAFVIPLALAVQTIAGNEALNDAEVQARSLAPVLATIHDPDLLAQLIRSASATSSGRVSVFMPAGEVLGTSASADADVALARTGRAFTSFASDSASVFVPVVIPGSGTAVVEVAIPNSRLHRGVAVAWAIIAATGAGLILLSVFVADRIARGVLAPTHALALAAQKVSQGDLETRVVPGGPPELTQVGRAFNLLVARISELLAAEREAAADLSHRLRTPLTALRINVDRLPKGPDANRLAADVQAVEQAVTDVIRELRRHTREGVRFATDLVSATRQRAVFWTALATNQNRPWTLDIIPTRQIVALPRDDVDNVIDVLLSNVFAHTPEGVPFRVAVDAAGRSRVRLAVEDEGPGFPRSMVARGESVVGSTGLGLDIARRAAESTGGWLEILDRPGGGARVEVVFATPDTRAPDSPGPVTSQPVWE